MINQHQFEQSARHFRSGRISLKEFSDRVFSGQKTTPHETKPTAKKAKTTTPITIAAQNKSVSELAETIAKALSDNPDQCPVLLTGIAADDGELLVKMVTDNDSKLVVKSDILFTPSV